MSKRLIIPSPSNEKLMRTINQALHSCPLFYNGLDLHYTDEYLVIPHGETAKNSIYQGNNFLEAIKILLTH